MQNLYRFLPCEILRGLSQMHIKKNTNICVCLKISLRIFWKWLLSEQSSGTSRQHKHFSSFGSFLQIFGVCHWFKKASHFSIAALFVSKVSFIPGIQTIYYLSVRFGCSLSYSSDSHCLYSQQDCKFVFLVFFTQATIRGVSKL